MRAGWEFQRDQARHRRRALIGQAAAAVIVVAIAFAVALVGFLLVGLAIILLGS